MDPLFVQKISSLPARRDEMAGMARRYDHEPLGKPLLRRKLLEKLLKQWMRLLVPTSHR